IGAGPESTVIDAREIDRVFQVMPGVASELRNLTVTNGRTNGEHGGGILNTGMLTLENSHVVSNETDKSGGGIYSTGTLTLSNSQVMHNDAQSGGGIYNNHGHVLLRNESSV